MVLNKKLEELNDFFEKNWKADNFDLYSKRARLFPNGKRNLEDENVSTSIFLASLVGIKEFREKIISSIDDKNSSSITNKTAELHAFVEIGKKEERPDGLIVLTTGKTEKTVSWAAYIEVKTKGNLEKSQIEKYLERAKSDGVPCIITISNNFVTHSNINPTGIDKNNLFHWSWKWILSELKMLSVNKLITDSDQSYMAEEFIKYLEGHKDIKDFNSMGETWKEDVKYLQDHKDSKNLKNNSSQIVSIANSWIQEEKDISIKLSTEKINDKCYKVDLDLTKDEQQSNKRRFEKIAKEVYEKKLISTSFGLKSLDKRVFSSSKSKISLIVDFIEKCCRISINIPAIKDKKAVAQATDFLKKIDGIGKENEFRVRAIFNGNKRNSDLFLVKDFQYRKEKFNECILIPEEMKKEQVKEFEISYKYEFEKDFYSPYKFVENIEKAVLTFYSQVVGNFIK